MAYDAAWTQWCDYLDIIGARQDWRGEKARELKLVLGKVMELEFGVPTANLRALYNIVSSPAVVSAVVSSLTHTAEDKAALELAVEGVVEP